MPEATSYGWAGKILRVNLSTGAISTQPTEPYKQYIGGMGLANKIMFDEVPAGTDPLSAENKLIIAVGPLTATGVPLAGRTTLASLSTFSKDYLVVDAHCGGMIGAQIKYAGYDAIVIEGAASKPVYIAIHDDNVSIKDADMVWGLGTRATTETLNLIEGLESCVAAIGPAGENLLPYSCLINSRNHSAGAGVGAVLGSKMCKAIVVQGTQSIAVADPQAIADLSDYMLRDIIGSNNNHVMPSTQQAWAEYYSKGSRWTSQPGLFWGLAEGGPLDTGDPIGTGVPKPQELNTVGYRCMKSTFDLGAEAAAYTVKMDGCHSCPIHCFADLRMEEAPALGGYEAAGNTCVAQNPFTRGSGFYEKEFKGEEALLWNTVASTLMDDLGLWCNYGQLYADISHTISKGILKNHISAEEWKELRFDERRAANDPQLFVDILRRIAQNNSELAYLGHGPYTWCARWDDASWFDTTESHLISYRGWPVHHAIECFGQVGGVCNMMFNRDDMVHSAVNFQGCGLPFNVLQDLAEKVWGDKSAIDDRLKYTPMNPYKAKFTWWSLVTDVLHDSLTLCNWVWPMTMSPTKSRNYEGDLDLEAKFYNAVTGENKTTDELYQAASKIMTLQRCNTMRGMGSRDLRSEHDVITEWVFTKQPELRPFEEGTDKMDRADFQLALTMVYQEFGWDEKLGCPTAATLDALGGMEDVKANLQEAGLL
ncbi:MAG: aldehyde ferredoxin oxidoreductase [Coriobacteriales bacterium]|jgi:aldehyde:ferredoxin oxidoreductase|nr:aldehyde ferredoxin oxidoreductase [Coriobacteriales bacterium]